MVQRKAKRTFLTAGAVLIVLLSIVGVIALLRGMGNEQTVNDQSSNTTESTTQPESTPSNEQPVSETETPNVEESTETPQLDPETVATIDISPMDLSVSYVKGVGGFEYLVQRTNSGSQYVEFRSPELIGTKCTDDAGAFASILEKPTENESSTISKKKTVQDTEYGLSLSASNCTSNVELLQKYQASFSDAFGLLRKIE